MSRVGSRAVVFVGLLVTALVAGNSANAGILTFYGDVTSPPAGPQITYDATDDRGQLGCSISCQGLLSTLVSGIYDPNVPGVATSGGWSTTAADLFYLANNSDATELAFVNMFANPDFATGTKTDTAGATSKTFSSAAEYILLKIGATPDVVLIWNTSGLLQTYTYLAYAGEGAGLSHYTEYGRVQVPEPGTLSLLGAGLVGLGFLRRRRATA